MTLVAGIDEAGYGPFLGPLVVAAAVFELGEDVRESELDRMARSRKDKGGLPIGDSKQLYNGPKTLGRIETSTLGHAVLGRGVLPLRISALLQHAVDFDTKDVEALPWYAKLMATPLPRRAVVDDVLERAARQQEMLEDRGIRFRDFFLAPVPEPRFNHMTRTAGSKAWTLFYAAGRLIETLATRFPGEDLVIHVDHHGGRVHYHQLLQSVFPMLPLRLVSEKRHLSSYELEMPGGPKMSIDFRVRADGKRACVGLASVVAKTTRELFMECLNGWFETKVPGVKPTAGYAADAKRFLKDVSKVDETQELREQLVRCW